MAAVLLAAPAAHAADKAKAGQSDRLSDERTFTRWAHAEKRGPIRARPDRRSHQIRRLRYETEDGFPEVYMVLRRLYDKDGRPWLRVRIPMRPNGRLGWVRERSLGILHLVRTRLVVDRRKLRARLYERGRAIWSSPVGIGARGTPTPRGWFWVRERIKVKRPGGLYGPWAFGTAAYSRLSDWPGGGVVGIHGTNQPELIPGRPSHGCIRVPNPRIRKLRRLMPIGTPVRIR